MNLQAETDFTSYFKVRQASAWWKGKNADAIWVEGSDAMTYLQSQITQDISKLEIGEGIASALVDRKAHIQSLFTLHRKEENLYLLVPECEGKTLFNHLESFHFVENVSLNYITDLCRLHIEGPQTPELLKTLTGKKFSGMDSLSLHSIAVPGGSAMLIPTSISAEAGIVLLINNDVIDAFIQVLVKQLGIHGLDSKSFESLRIESGHALFGVDMSNETQLPATGQETFRVSYDKGCYLGQEVIARIRTYGVPPYKLMGLISDTDLPLGDFKIEGKKRGNITSVSWSPGQKAYLALAYIHKSCREPGQTYELTLDGQSFQCEIVRLPFYTPPSQSEQAQLLYDQALTAFAEDDETAAIQLLYSAIEKDTHLADAYESLGVILSRMGQHEEAISVMKQLTEISPEEPMAHTNLSRFYMLIGDKQTAEDHMAEATRLDMQKRSSAMQQEALKAQEREQKESMISMFKEVLETEDSEDLVANFGLGKSLVDLDRFTEAEPYLQKAVSIDPYYSAAYLQLGKALTEIGKEAEAKDVYDQGIKAAAEKGDLMPMKEMEQRLMGLSL